jgi:acyl carrier protein
MPSFDEIGQIVFDALNDLSATLPDEDGIARLTLDSPLFGENGALDSLGLVNLVVLTERRVEDAYGTEISLADDNALAADENPFRTVRSYVALTSALVEAALAGGQATTPAG